MQLILERRRPPLVYFHFSVANRSREAHHTPQRHGFRILRPHRRSGFPFCERTPAMSNPLLDIPKFGQSIWYDNIRRGLITSGELQKMVDEDGLLGVTSNPAIF